MDAREPEDREARRRAAFELAQARRFVRAIRVQMAVSGILLGLFAYLTRYVPTLPFVLGASAAISLLGAWQICRAPSLCSFVGATLGTAVMILWQPRIPADPPLRVFAAFIVLSMWFGVGMARKLRPLLAAHPDIWISRRMRGERPEDEHVAMRSRHRDRACGERVRLARRIVPIALAAIVGFSAAALAIHRPPAPPGSEQPSLPPWGSIEPSVARFAVAWNANRLKDVEALLPDATRDRQSALLEHALKRRGCLDSPPRLGAAAVGDGGQISRATFPLAGAPDGPPLTTYWQNDGIRWCFVNLSVKRQE